MQPSKNGSAVVVEIVGVAGVPKREFVEIVKG
jgi:hypothetical protein